MVTRNSTSIFILMRDNAVRHRSFYVDQRNNDHVSLIQRQNSHDVEIQNAAGTAIPEVVHGYEEMQYDFDRIQARMRELAQLHDRHLNRPSMDDSIEEEPQIQELTNQLTEAFSRCHRKLKLMNSSSTSQFSGNIHQSLARNLHDMSSEFRSSQSTYLRKLKNREDKSAFQLYQGPAADDDGLSEFIDRGFSLQLVEDTTALVHQREQEINSVVRSINELNEIFTDIARLVVDQGEVIDRIDYNLENVQTRVYKGLQQLRKAEKYQKKNSKMLMILVLAGLIVILTIILVFTKFKRSC